MGKYAIGEFEEVILLTVAILYENAYGISIKQDIEARLNRRVSNSRVNRILSLVACRARLLSWRNHGGATSTCEPGASTARCV